MSVDTVSPIRLLLLAHLQLLLVHLLTVLAQCLFTISVKSCCTELSIPSNAETDLCMHQLCVLWHCSLFLKFDFAFLLSLKPFYVYYCMNFTTNN